MTFSVTEWLKRSTAASNVPLYVKDRQVIEDVAARIKVKRKPLRVYKHR